jgi:hypothetical protein
MFKKAALFLILTDFGLTSCQSYLTRKYELGKTHRFENKKQFADFIEKQTGIKADDIYYTDSIGYVNLMKSLQVKSKEGILWGFYGGDSLFDNRENENPDKLYCKKRIQDIISAFVGQSVLPVALMVNTNELLKFHLKNLKENSPFVLFDIQGKNRVILQYAAGFGTYYKDLFDDVRAIIQAHDDSTELALICLDPVFKLK